MPRPNHAAAKADQDPFVLPPANPERVETLRAWLADKAVSIDEPVAGMALTIMAGGRIDAAMRGIEVEHVDDLVRELSDLREALLLWKDARTKDGLLLRCDVVKLAQYKIE
jgi:hypothetical protein